MSPLVPVRLLLSQSDERLVGYARAGHERAFEALVQRYRRQLLAYCRRLLLSEQRAEDALQQALLQAWVALRNGNEVSEPRAWLYRIVHNAAVNTLRSSRYDYCQLSESLSGADAPHADLDRRIAVREALAGLAALPEMQREALLRTAVGGDTHQQAASDLGVSEPALRGLVYRARVSLRTAVGSILPPPLIGWALEAGTSGTPALERVAGGLGAGGGAAGLAGLLVKGGAVAVTAGALAGGIVASHARHPSAHHVRGSAQGRPGPLSKPTLASVRPVAFTEPVGVKALPHPRRAKDTASAPTPTQRTRTQHAYRSPATRQRTVPVSPPAAIPSWTRPTGRPTHHGDRMFEPRSGGPSKQGGSSGDSQRDGGRDGHDHSGSGGHDGGVGATNQNDRQTGQANGQAATSNARTRDGGEGKESSADGPSGEWQSSYGSNTSDGGNTSDSGNTSR